jgi:arsenite methyltransferase
MAELTSVEKAAEPCCASEAQATCCEPSAKAECCGHEEGCGCDAGDAGEQAGDVRERVASATRRPPARRARARGLAVAARFV